MLSLKSVVHAGNEKKLIKPSELDIYYEPELIEIVPRNPPYPAIIYENVSAARTRITGVFSGLLTTHEKVSSFFGSLESRITNVYTETLEDPSFLLTPSVIITATIGGALFAGRGKRPFTRSLYAGLFGTTALAVTYPQRSLEIAATGYYHTSASLSNLVQLWKKRSANITEKVMTKLENVPVENIEENVVLTESNVVLSETVAADDENVDTVVSSSDAAVVEKPVITSSETTVVEDTVITSSETTVVEGTNENNVQPPQEELKVVIEEIIKADVLDESSELVDNKSSELVDNESSELTGDESSELVVEADYGQSDPDDKDMYSTRS